MPNMERIILGISIALNAILVIALIFMFTNRPVSTPPETIAQIEATPDAVGQPSQTPIIITVVATPTVEKAIEITPEIVIELTETAVPTQTPEPTNEPSPTSEPSPTMEPSPTPEPTPTEVILTGPDWLRYINQFRAQANLPLLIEEEKLSDGAANHSYYMVLNSASSHNENATLPGYSHSGLIAGQNGNIAVSGAAGVSYYWPIDYWMSAAFHAIPMLDPRLTTIGYGTYSDASSSFGMAATLDVKSGLDEASPDTHYPIMFPRDGGQIWVTTYNLPEFPDSTTGCNGYQKPTGAPIILLLGDGGNTPHIRETRLEESGNSLAHCAFDETDYYNSNPNRQSIGRNILEEHDAVVILPRSPLKVGQEYHVYVNNAGDIIEWTFTVTERP